MSILNNRLYLYEQYIDYVISGNSLNLDNRPMNNRRIVAHKGVTNDIFLNVRDRDRKKQNVFAHTLRAYIVSPTTKKRLVSRILEHTSDIGVLKLTLAEGDLAGINPGLYKIYITMSEDEVQDRPVYSDQNNNVAFDIEIADQLGLTPIPTQTQNTFLQTGNTMIGDASNTFVTNALYGNLDRNFADAQHTMAIYPNTYTGQVTIQASCLTAVPDNDDASTDWFDVKNIDLSNTSSIAHTNFNINCNWVRIISKPESGSIDKVLLRN